MARLIRRNAGSLSGHRRVIALSTTLVASVIVGGLASPAGATQLPAALSFSAPLHASQDKFTPRGGYSTLTATVRGATACTLSISPAIADVRRASRALGQVPSRSASTSR
jgi:hypothetical protein